MKQKHQHIWGEFRSVLHATQIDREEQLVSLISKWSSHLNEMEGLFKYILEHVPRWNPACVDVPPASLLRLWLRDGVDCFPLLFNTPVEDAQPQQNSDLWRDIMALNTTTTPELEFEVVFCPATENLIRRVWTLFCEKGKLLTKDQPQNSLTRHISDAEVFDRADLIDEVLSSSTRFQPFFYFNNILINTFYKELPTLGLFLHADMFEIIWLEENEWCDSTLISFLELFWQIGAQDIQPNLLNGYIDEPDPVLDLYNKYIPVRQLWAQKYTQRPRSFSTDSDVDQNIN